MNARAPNGLTGDTRVQKLTRRRMFRLVAESTARAVGSPWAFAVATLVIVGWACLGPVFHFSDTWQLVVNTATTIVTFLMVFLIQNTQNRDSRAIHLKLDELLRGVQGARTGLVNLESLTDEELDRLQKEFEDLCVKKNKGVRKSFPE
jgi:low affinity Fe/Cu permease